MLEQAEVAPGGADDVSQPAPTTPAEKAAAALRSRVDLVVERLASAQAISQDSQVREALTRTELTLALNEALIAGAEAEAGRREQAFRAFALAHGSEGPLQRPKPFNPRWEKLPWRLRSIGHALAISRSGLWRGSGELQEIIAYVRRGADPTAEPKALLDQGWYLAAYPDAAAGGRAPLLHYLLEGAAQDRSPHPLFDVAYYKQTNASELATTGLSPLEHFVRRGMAQGRNPHPLFDLRHYVAQATDIEADDDPLNHYLREGWLRDLSPHPLFDPVWYRARARHPRNVPPLLHYLRAGAKRSHAPHPLFDPDWYLEQNPDVAQSGAEPLTHFVTSGAQEGRSPSPWFDLAHYAAVRGEALEAGVNPLVDYLRGGAWAVTEAMPGLPTAAYLASSPEMVREGLTPLEHWARRHSA